MNSATISADIISYTSLSEKDKRGIVLMIKQLLSELSKKYKKEAFFGRIVQGDSIECAMASPVKALRIALLLKTFIKSIVLENTVNKTKRQKYFRDYAIRLAVAVAPLNIIDKRKGIIDGEAIYLSGREIKKHSTSGMKKIVIKNSMFFCSPNEQEREKFGAFITLLDTIIAKCSAKQCEVIYYKLLGYSEKEISLKLGKNQSTISQHSTAAGWLAIEKSVHYFEENVAL